MISALNTCLVIEQRKTKVLQKANLKSKRSQELYLKLLMHFTGITKIQKRQLFIVIKINGYFLNAYLHKTIKKQKSEVYILKEFYLSFIICYISQRL